MASWLVPFLPCWVYKQPSLVAPLVVSLPGMWRSTLGSALALVADDDDLFFQRWEVEVIDDDDKDSGSSSVSFFFFFPMIEKQDPITSSS